MASESDQRQPDPEWQNDEERPDEPSAGDNRPRGALRRAVAAVAAWPEAAKEMLAWLLPFQQRDSEVMRVQLTCN